MPDAPVIYISGPITGRERDASERFDGAEAELRERGYRCRNPWAEVPRHLAYGEALRRAVGILLECDAVALLDGWDRSRGCAAEVHVAVSTGMKVLPLGSWTAAPSPATR